MASADWKREQVEHLIASYKKHPVMYNMRHPRYYNKGSRGEALNDIVRDLHDIRPETTPQDVLRKIQTLRTQFGQEITKSRRANKHGVSYIPTAWWFNGLSFLQHHIKHRSMSPTKSESDLSWKREDDDSSYKISIIQNEALEGDASNNDYEHSMDGTDYDTEIHYEIEPIDSKNKSVELKAVPSTAQYSNKLNGTNRKAATQRSIILPTPQTEQPQVAAPVPASTTVVELPSSIKDPLCTSSLPWDVIVPIDRNRSLGNFVASQMAQIKDDYSFYMTQNEVLNIINKTILKQFAQDTGTSSSEGSSGGHATNK